MAVITVSKIQVRSGLQEDLPALDSGEFGWCVDTQRLFIGKGTLAEGAPTTGVTEILTEYSIGLINLSIDQVVSDIANINVTLGNLTSVIGNLQSVTTQILDNQSSIVNIGNVSVESLSSQIINYNITRNTAVRIGSIRVTTYNGSDVSFDDEYTETTNTGVTLYFTGNTVTNTAVLGYSTSSTGDNGNLTYSYTNLRSLAS
jgi:hypothetical protein